MKPAFHPSHTLWKSLRDSHIPTASTTGYMFSHALKSNHRRRKGVVTDVSGPQRNACPGTLRQSLKTRADVVELVDHEYTALSLRKPAPD
jgi:hypothetical protein